jgi:hypothetical protein
MPFFGPFLADLHQPSRFSGPFGEIKPLYFAKFSAQGSRCPFKGPERSAGRWRLDAAKISALRALGRSWPQIARELGVSVGTVYQRLK